MQKAKMATQRFGAREKLEMALKRGHFRTVDLFAGCGGLSLGFDRAGFKSVAAIELDDDARMSHALNFKSECYRGFPDVTKCSPNECVSHLGEPSKQSVDVVIGGPPCQAFSRLGRARLWQLAGERGSHYNDERATMYQYYLEYIRSLEPIAFVMENVREIGKFCGRNVAEEIALEAEEMGYSVRYTLLNAVWFGVPQLRERAFIVGIKKELDVLPVFPVPKFSCDIPTGYSTSKVGRGELQFLTPNDHFVETSEPRKNLPKAVSLEQAFKDLPPIYSHLLSPTNSKRAQDPDARTPYASKCEAFGRKMRDWPGFENVKETFSGHIIRNTPRDYLTFKLMPEGGMYPDAVKTAEGIFEKELKKMERRERRKIEPHSIQWEDLRRTIVPPYPVDKYPNKFRKLWRDQPARTLPAHIGKDSYSHIHFDGEQARGISLREAARIQSFPDEFKLHGSMNSRLKQIGNAVPPLMAYAIAENLRNILTRS